METCPTNLEPFQEHFISKGDSVNTLTAILKEKPTNQTVLPSDDFYSFINEEWINNVELGEKEKYITQIDDFRTKQHQVYSQVIELVKGQKDDVGLQNIYKSGLKRLSAQQAKKHIYNYKHYLDLFIKSNNIWGFLGAANRNEIYKFGLPIVIDIYADEKDAKTMRTHLNGPRFTLVDTMVYFPELAEKKEDIDYNNEYKIKYFNYITQLSKLSGEKMDPENIWDIELCMLNSFAGENDEKDDDEIDGYFNFNVEKVNKLGVDWITMATNYGFNEELGIPNVIFQNKGYLKRIAKQLNSAFHSKLKDKWRQYFLFLFIKQLSIFTNEWKNTVFEFNGKFMRGISQDFPDELFPIFCLSFCYNTKITHLYVDKYLDQQKIDYVNILANDLKIVFKRKISRNNWLQPHTKVKALEKLDNFHFEFGEPSNLGNDPPLENVYVDDDIYANFLKVIDWRTKQYVAAEGLVILDTPAIDWTNVPIKLVGSQAYIVNAMYTPSKNGIYIPLGYIQPPFIDLKERGIEYNLAFIGTTLAHEMSHSLDDAGSKFDAQGNLNNWWAPEDEKMFKEKQDDVSKQYKEWYARDGIYDFDPSNAIGESIADICGFSICMEYLENFQEYNKNILPIKALSFKAFFLYYAFQQKQKIDKNAIVSQLRTNPHPFSKYRCNVPLSRIQMFNDMYDITGPQNKMFWNNKDTIY